MAVRIGVGQSVRFLRSHRGLVGKVARGGAFAPDNIILGLDPHVLDPTLDITAFHVFTFNQLATTERWRSEMLTRLNG